MKRKKREKHNRIEEAWLMGLSLPLRWRSSGEKEREKRKDGV